MPNHFTHDNSIAEGVALAHTVYGSPVTATMQPNSHGSNIGPATWSSAPYKPPARRHRDNPEMELCAEEGCLAYPGKDVGGYCTGHAKTRGLAPKCAKPDCKASPKTGTDYCRWHGPKESDASTDAG